ncbi:MAG: beta-galactosidase [Lachnospiraceae bacterium]|nr:beta-galactosidase [Lachnospiraceae bacterium]
MIESKKVKKVLYGGDYNPEQWPEDIWQEDMRLFKLAHIDVVTISVFSWAKLQPSEDTYDFSQLDKIMALVKENNLSVCLATATAAHPAWMARKYPDILRVEHNGMKRAFGSRHNSCPNSPTYRKYSVALAAKIAERYKDYENIVSWHVSNEYGGECYCENCQKAFRVWLKNRYKTIDELNRVWNTAFWSHTMYDFDDVVVPDLRSEEFHWERMRTNFQGISLDYKRFISYSLQECYRLEKAELKRITPDMPVTTNLMGFYKPLDYQSWAEDMDFISWDNYPAVGAGKEDAAMTHDMMRGLKQGKAFCLMEQTPGVSNWHIYCSLKRPGVMRLWSYQAIAHGSDTVMFFQMRRSIGACEKFHSGVIEHVGTENTRIFREVTALGKELDLIGSAFLGARTKAEVAIVFDWENWWAVELSAGPSKLINYHSEVMTYYRAFAKQNISVDMVSVKDDLLSYKLVVAPLLYMCKDGFDEKIRAYVKNGGVFVTSYFSGIVEDHDLVVTGGYPGRLRDILGIWVEECDAIPEGMGNSFSYGNKKRSATIMCDLLHLEGAKALSTYEEDFYVGMPALTLNEFGNGKAYYVATRSDEEFYDDFLGGICNELMIQSVQKAPLNVEATLRENENGQFLFLLNHGEDAETVVLERGGTDLISGKKYEAPDSAVMEKKDVIILKLS